MRLSIPSTTLDQLSQLVADSLANLGYAHRRQDGTTQTILFRRRQITRSGSLLLLEVDTQRLPHGVRAGDLVDKDLLHHLTAVVHYPVQALNTVGVTYVIRLAGAAERPKLPDHADLAVALAQHPGGAVIPVGLGPAGPAWAPLDGHFLVGGASGSGKTTWLLAALLALSRVNPPQDLQVVIVDPKAVDFAPLGSLPHLARPIAREPEEAAETVAWLVGQMAERQRKFLRLPARSLVAYNAHAPQKLPRLVVVIDEVTDLALRLGLKSAFYKDLIRLACQGRAFGLYLVLATQNPKAEVLDTLIRGNLSTRIACRVSGAEQSRIILGMAGAEQLPRIPGRLLARLDSGRPQELQGYAVTDEELAGLGGAAPADMLDAETRAMLQYALEHLRGRFPQAELMAAGWSRPQYRQAIVKLRQTGLLERGPQNAWLICSTAKSAAFEGLDAVDRLTV